MTDQSNNNTDKNIDKKVVPEATPNDVTDAETPDSLAEATTAPLKEGALGGHADQDDAKK